MKSTTIALALIILVAVVYSAPAGFNTNSRPSQGSGSSFSGIQVQPASQFGNYALFQGPASSGVNSQSGNIGQFIRPIAPIVENQVQEVDQSSKDAETQGLASSVDSVQIQPIASNQVQPVDGSAVNGQFQRPGSASGNNGNFQGFIPLIGRPIPINVDSQNRYNFPTGIPFAGAHGVRGDITQQPMNFGRDRHERKEHA